jgi:GNAT superfamily N-acetyltransferase
MDNIEIKPATINDIPLILEYIKSAAETENLKEYVIATEATLEKSLFSANPLAEAIIAYINQKPVGYALFWQSFSMFSGSSGLYIENIYIIPSARGKNVAKRILNFLFEIAKARKYSKIEGLVWDKNPKLGKFYKRFGFQPWDQWRIYGFLMNR